MTLRALRLRNGGLALLALVVAGCANQPEKEAPKPAPAPAPVVVAPEPPKPVTPPQPELTPAQAKAQADTAQQHLQALQNVGGTEQINMAAAQVAAAKGHFESAEAQASYAEIRSPINGVVTDRPLYQGEMAAVGAPLLTVMDLSKVVARINMAHDQAKNVRVGNEATITPTDGGGYHAVATNPALPGAEAGFDVPAPKH